MYARLVTNQVPPQVSDQMVAATISAKETMAPVYRSMPGFLGAYYLADRANGIFVGLTFWDTLEHAQGYEDATAQMREQASQGAPAGVTQHLEVFDQLMP
jgi:heme-degrading monooxygenase HmoA